MAMNMDAMLRIKADVQGENNIRRLGNSMQGLQGQAKNAAMNFSSLKGAVMGFGAAIAGSAIVGGLTAIVKKSIDAGDELFNLQAKTGIAAKALIGLGNAAKLADVDQGTLAKGLTKLSVNLVKAAEGNDDLARKFQALGVKVKDSNGQVVPADRALKQIADRFADMPDGAQKAAAAVALFGKSGAELIPLLNEGATSMEKFTYKVGDDFAARSDLFNDTITELGIKAQGFGLELTDALLPALQSILEVFGDLFDTDQDWTALFKVIEGVIRGIAVAIYIVVKAVDVLIKNVVAAVQAAGQALSGDFGAAWQTITSRVSSGIEEQKKILADLNKLAFGSAPSPGTGRRTSGRSMGLDTTDADRKADAEAKRRAAEAKRAAAEQERLEDRRASLTQRAISLQEQLQNSVADVAAAYKSVGASPVDQLLLDRNGAITENERQVKQLTLSVVELVREINEAGGSIDAEPYKDLIDKLYAGNLALADRNYQQGLKDLLPSLADYDAKIAEVTRGKTELTELEKLNAEVNLLQLDILAQTNPALAEHVRLLRERAKALDDATKKQKTDSESIGAGIRDRLQDYYNSVKDLGGAIGDAVVSGLKGLEDQLTAFVTTGKANFKELAASILSDLARIALRAAIIGPIVKAIGGLFPGFKFATGGIMTSDGPLPLKKYARGGIANSPQLAMFGEGSMPEAYVPLPDGRRIPVAMKGGGGGNSVQVDNITINVENSGEQLSPAAQKQIAGQVRGIVLATLVDQRRGGGVLR
jgi:hypothetical protein